MTKDEGRTFVVGLSSFVSRRLDKSLRLRIITTNITKAMTEKSTRSSADRESGSRTGNPDRRQAAEVRS